MRQIELPALIIRGDGTWSIDVPNQKRRNPLENYPSENPMYEFIQAIDSDFKERKNNLEFYLQMELDQVNTTRPALQNLTPDTWLSRTSDNMTELLLRKKSELEVELNHIQIYEGFDKLKASYNSLILKDQIASLQDRQTRLNAEINRRQVEAAKQATEHANAVLAESRQVAEEEARRLSEGQIDEHKRGPSFVADPNKYIFKKSV
ncbi:hypothetical protein [Pseudomonas citrulli]|uniref:Uncharacterized protein n=1 Tax=Pseudomonas citrulli TaxID=3064347 RepID=A0ABT9C4D2_9PSED|nr:hypothetical protein [Pseudomonas sp. K18]MDO7899644.1 hypothetical protein [Pseudomonas sp. K18]